MIKKNRKTYSEKKHKNYKKKFPSKIFYKKKTRKEIGLVMVKDKASKEGGYACTHDGDVGAVLNYLVLTFDF
jgi:hypothetical protein